MRSKLIVKKESAIINHRENESLTVTEGRRVLAGVQTDDRTQGFGQTYLQHYATNSCYWSPLLAALYHTESFRRYQNHFPSWWGASVVEIFSLLSLYYEGQFCCNLEKQFHCGYYSLIHHLWLELQGLSCVQVGLWEHWSECYEGRGMFLGCPQCSVWYPVIKMEMSKIAITCSGTVTFYTNELTNNPVPR